MTFVLRGAELTLAWFFAVSAAASLLVAAVAPLRSLRRRGLACFAVRVLPAAAATFFALIIFLPSYWRYEPRQSGEGFDLTLTSCALAALAMLGVATFRAARAWQRARRLARSWTDRARPFEPEGCAVPAFAIDSAMPIVALAGIVRPRLFIARRVIEALTGDELQSVIAHEVAHHRAWDNLKRLLMCAAPDLLAFTGTAHVLERRWASAAEHAADELCGDDRPSARCALASALVKVARLTTPLRPAAAPISMLIDEIDITSRIERLLADRPPLARSRSRAPRVVAVTVVCALVAGTFGPLIAAVHEATEVLVRLLP